MLRIVQAVTEEVNRLLACISRMNSNGCIQVRIHSIFLDQKCSSNHSSNLISVIVILHCKGEMFLVSLNSIFDFLSDQKQNAKKMNNLLESITSVMMLQLNQLLEIAISLLKFVRFSSQNFFFRLKVFSMLFKRSSSVWNSTKSCSYGVSGEGNANLVFGQLDRRTV